MSEGLALRGSRLTGALGLFLTPAMILKVGGGYMLADLLLLMSVILGLVAKPHMGPLGWGIQVGAYLVGLGGFLSAARASDPLLSLTATARLEFIMVCLVWVARLHLRSEVDVIGAMTIYALGTSIFGAFSVIDATLPTLVNLPSANGRYAGLAGHVTDAGGICAIGTAMVLGIILARGLSIGRAWLLLASLLGTLLSGSVSAFLSILAGGVFAAYQARMPRRTMVMLLGGVVAVISLGPWAVAVMKFHSPMERLSASTSGRYATVEGRTRGVEWAADTLSRDYLTLLMGRGLDGNAVAPDGLPVHNAFFGALISGGFLTLMGISVVMLYAVREVVSRRGGRIPIGGSVVCAIVFAQSSPILTNRYAWLPVVMLLGTIERESLSEGADRKPAGLVGIRN